MSEVKKNTLYLLCAVILSLCMIYYAIHLKKSELNYYVDPTPRYLFMGFGIGIFILSSFILLLLSINNYLNHKKIESNNYKSIGPYILSGFFLSYFIILIYGAGSLENYFKNEELKSLKKKGTTTLVQISSYSYTPGKNSHYKYFFSLIDFKNIDESLYVERDLNILNVGDTIGVIYLKVNPTIFREIEVINDTSN